MDMGNEKGRLKDNNITHGTLSFAEFYGYGRSVCNEAIGLFTEFLVFFIVNLNF
jgi:hypothetical protein